MTCLHMGQEMCKAPTTLSRNYKHLFFLCTAGGILPAGGTEALLIKLGLYMQVPNHNVSFQGNTSFRNFILGSRYDHILRQGPSWPRPENIENTSISLEMRVAYREMDPAFPRIKNKCTQSNSFLVYDEKMQKPLEHRSTPDRPVQI